MFNACPWDYQLYGLWEYTKVDEKRCVDRSDGTSSPRHNVWRPSIHYNGTGGEYQGSYDEGIRSGAPALPESFE